MTAQMTTAVADTFLDCLERSRNVTQPFYYWLLEDVLPARDVDDLSALAISAPKATAFTGRRETGNSARVFFNAEMQQRFPVCRRIVEGFKDPRVMTAIETETGAQLDGTRLRIEYCQDSPGFWQEPHTDIAVKKCTLVVYLLSDPALRLAGTDILEGPPDHAYVTTAPYGRNLGLIFIPAGNTWHGDGHHPLKALRKMMIVNYVGRDWRHSSELS